MADDPKRDPIAEAIASTDPTDLVAIPVTIAGTGRKLVMAVPGPLTGMEALELVAWIANGGPNRWLAEHAAGPRLEIARGLPSNLKQ